MALIFLIASWLIPSCAAARLSKAEDRKVVDNHESHMEQHDVAEQSIQAEKDVVDHQKHGTKCDKRWHLDAAYNHEGYEAGECRYRILVVSGVACIYHDQADESNPGGWRQW